MFSDMPLAHTYSADEAKGYLLKSYQQNEWRTCWWMKTKNLEKYKGGILKDGLKRHLESLIRIVYEALRLDRDGFVKVKETSNTLTSPTRNGYSLLILSKSIILQNQSHPMS